MTQIKESKTIYLVHYFLKWEFCLATMIWHIHCQILHLKLAISLWRVMEQMSRIIGIAVKKKSIFHLISVFNNPKVFLNSFFSSKQIWFEERFIPFRKPLGPWWIDWLLPFSRWKRGFYSFLYLPLRIKVQKLRLLYY